MSKKHKDNGQTEEQSVPYTGKTYAYFAAGLTGLAAVAIGLIFTVLGIYSLIASILLSLASLAFINVQKRKNNFQRLKIINVCAYTVLIIGAVIFVCGLIWSAI